jgi:hypothetical protein
VNLVPAKQPENAMTALLAATLKLFTTTSSVH